MKWICAIFLCALVTGVFSQEALSRGEASEILRSANSALLEKKYDEAIVSYEKLFSAGYETVELHHNLSLAYHDAGALAESILNMERAKRLAPLNGNVRKNLKLLYENVDSEVQNLPPFFLKAWANGVSSLLPSLLWFILHIFFLISTTVFLYLYLIRGFHIGNLHFYYTRGLIIGLAALSLLFAGLSYNSDKLKSDSEQAVILESNTSLRAGADLSSVENSSLPEGLKVVIKDEIGDFYKIRLGDYTDGWVEKNAVERVTKSMK